MMNTCKPARPPLPRRLGRVLGRALLLSLPGFVISLAVQGGREFSKEIADHRKYRKIIKNMKREDRESWNTVKR